MKYNVEINKIKWLDKEAREADISFLLNGVELNAFSHPCDLIEGEKIEVDLDYIEEDISFDRIFNGNKSMQKEFKQRHSNNWSYEIYGQIKQIDPLILDCGKFNFQFDYQIKDKTVVGSFIYMPISRLDIMKI